MKTNILSIRTTSITAFLFSAISSFSIAISANEQMSTLALTITEGTTGKTVPARLEILGSDGQFYVAEDALLIGGDCETSDQGAGYVDLETTLAGFTDRIENHYRKSTQFYSNGTSTIHLPVGTATITVFKGPEYDMSVNKVQIRVGEVSRQNISLNRWINMPKKRWYSSDGHLHIPRPVKELNPYILEIMKAEDIHVANLLQMGKVKNFSIAKQHAHGPESYYQEGNYILAAGQENPRTHFFGHTITLGAKTALHDPESYLIYRLIWEKAVKQGGINGFAHAYLPNGFTITAHDGMAVILPHNLLHFVEVLQWNRSDYELWYDILSLGFRVTPTAGSDYPCGQVAIPGHERFYTKVQDPLTYDNWLEGVRKGRTFVTTGPVIEFRIDGQDIGSEIMLENSTFINVTGNVTFDPEADDVSFVEVIQNGHMVKRFSRVNGEKTIEFTFRHLVNASSWFALRGYGEKPKENNFVNPWHFSSFKPSSNVHSAPIYVTIKNSLGIEKSPESKKIARTWLARLEDLEVVLAEDNVEYLGRKLEQALVNKLGVKKANFDGVPPEVLKNNRPELLKEIQIAKDFFKKLSQ